MAATIGTLVAYDHSSQSWEEYIEIIQHFFAANGINDANKQKSVLISAVGAETYSLMRNLVSPDKPGDRSFDELVKLMKDHYNPRPSEIVQRFRFNSRVRQPDESVSEFVAQLRKLAQDCNYGVSLSQMLRDRLVCGINDEHIQRRLLSESGLTFESALKSALALESAHKHTQDLQGKTACNSIREGGNPNVAFRPGEKKTGGEGKTCYRCNGSHDPSTCRFRQEKCHSCGKIGHIGRACRNARKQSDQKANKKERGRSSSNRAPSGSSHSHHVSVDSDDDETADAEQAFSMYSIKDRHSKVKPITVDMEVHGENVKFEVDTGCSITLMNESEFNAKWKNGKKPKMGETSLKLKTYTGEDIKVLGVADVKVNYQNQWNNLPLYVVSGTGPSLLGRSWLEQLKLNWAEIHNMKVAGGERLTVEQVLAHHEDVFKDELGTLKGVKATINIVPGAVPRYFRPRQIPFAMRPKVEAEISRLLKDEIITPVKHSDWACPVVPILKQDGSIRLCGDYKLTVNRVSLLEQYPIPKIEDLFTALAGGQQFSKLDMSHAYAQILMDEDSKKYLTVNTHKGLFAYNRLPFGVSSAPAIFQRTMEGLLQGIPMVAVYLDDILVTGLNAQDHLKNLNEVLGRLEEAGLRLKRSKCELLKDEVCYLGHKVNAQGLHPMKSKVKAISEAPAPSNVSELKAYLGLLNYYNRFLPNLSTLLAPMHQLLRKDEKWVWKTEQDEAFHKSKELLQSADVLVHYSADKELILACDASPYGVGAVLSHRMPDGAERPLGFMSRTLSSAEKRYSQLDKEGLAVIFGIQRFHKYLYGRKFTITTDHKPLITLFHEMKPVPHMLSPRIQRWSVLLRAYEYKIIYKPGKFHSNADGLSRLPVPSKQKEEETPERVLMLDQVDDIPINVAQVRKWTSKDVILSRVYSYILSGWPLVQDSELMPYYSRRMELNAQDGCILWGARTVIPPPGRTALLKALHQSHPGMCRMKALARSYMWWPQMDQEIEKKVSKCQKCQENRKAPPNAPLHPWEWPERPWLRIHVDYAGPFLGKMFLIIVDAHSKWLEVYPTNGSTTQTTIEKLRQCFAAQGLPQILVSDNGSCFTSSEFCHFMAQNGIQHITSAPFHPSSNGLAERAVQTFKEGMKKMEGGSIEARVSKFLFSYRITPQTTTGLSPAEMLMNRRLRSAFDLLKPDIKSKIEHKQMKQKENHDKTARLRRFGPGDAVYARNYGLGPKWIPATVESPTGPVSYTVILGNGQRMRRHVDQVRARHPESSLTVERTPELPEARSPDDEPETSSCQPETAPSPPGQVNLQGSAPGRPDSPAAPSAELRRSTRDRVSPRYLKDYVS